MKSVKYHDLSHMWNLKNKMQTDYDTENKQVASRGKCGGSWNRWRRLTGTILLSQNKTSHGGVIYSIRLWSLYGDRWFWIYQGHLTTYANIKSSCSIPEINIILYINCIPICYLKYQVSVNGCQHEKQETEPLCSMWTRIKKNNFLNFQWKCHIVKAVNSHLNLFPTNETARCKCKFPWCVLRLPEAMLFSEYKHSTKC